MPTPIELGILGVIVGFAIGSFLLVPVPLIALWIWSWAAPSSNPDDDLSGIRTLFLVFFATVGVIVGVIARKFVRFARAKSRQAPPTA